MTRLFKLSVFLFLLSLGFAIALPNLPVFHSEFNLRLLHTNDHHAHLEPININNHSLGGIAQRKTLVDSLINNSKTPTLLLDAGDIFQGTLYFNQYLGQADLPFYNQLNYAAVSLGNHEFDRGQTVLANFIKKAKFPLLSANITLDPKSPLSGLVKPWVIIPVRGEKIGIFGLITEETINLSNPGQGITFKNSIQTAKQTVETLQKKGVNKIIALTHLGIESDLNLARQVNGIDVIIGGHSHTPLGSIPNAKHPYPLVEKNPNGDPVLVVTDWEWGKYLGDLEVKFDQTGNVIDWQGSLHPIDHKIKADTAFAQQLKVFSTPLAILRQTIIGKTALLLDGNRDKIRTQGTNLGNLIADAVLYQLKSDGGQIAILNGGGIRASIPPGNISISQVIEALPFGNTIGRVDLTGQQIKQALEHGVSKVEFGEGQFPQVSGLRFVYNPKAPAGSRIVSIAVLDQKDQEKPLNLNATYRVVTNSFLMTGGDGYESLKAGKNAVDTGFLLVDAVIDYIKEKSPINYNLSDRIIVQQSS